MIQKKNIQLFLQSYTQILLVVANTYFIANNYILGIALACFFISYVWTLNVKKISVSNFSERVIYSLGAMLGGLSGYFISLSFLQ